MPGTKRLDVWLADAEHFRSRNRAQQAIKKGLVTVDGEVATRASMKVSAASIIRVTGGHRYVGRGGEKLEAALTLFELDVTGLTVLDAGASTGGFTDCLLQRGAGFVCAVDVGHDQLDQRLRRDPRVKNLEGVNLREARVSGFPGHPFDLAVCDLSFISVTRVLAALRDAVRPGAHILVLVKPQFEAGPDNVGRGGVVRSFRIHLEVLVRVARFARSIPLLACDCHHSPILGAGGNMEFFLLLGRPPVADGRFRSEVEKDAGYMADCVERAHRELLQSPKGDA